MFNTFLKITPGKNYLYFIKDYNNKKFFIETNTYHGRII